MVKCAAPGKSIVIIGTGQPWCKATSYGEPCRRRRYGASQTLRSKRRNGNVLAEANLPSSHREAPQTRRETRRFHRVSQNNRLLLDYGKVRVPGFLLRIEIPISSYGSMPTYKPSPNKCQNCTSRRKKMALLAPMAEHIISKIHPESVRI